jgi:hypothetical protein
MDITDREEPTLVIPHTAQADPIRANDLRDRDEPPCAMSSTEKDEAQYNVPITERLEPIRAKLLRENEAPT